MFALKESKSGPGLPSEELVLQRAEYLICAPLFVFTREFFRNSRGISFEFYGMGKGAVPLLPFQSAHHEGLFEPSVLSAELN